MTQTMTPAEAVERFAGTHYKSAEFRGVLDNVDWLDVWPEIDGDGNLTGRLVDSEDGYANVGDDAMISIAVANAAGWTVEDGYASPPWPARAAKWPTPPLPPAGETLTGDCGGPSWPPERGNPRRGERT